MEVTTKYTANWAKARRISAEYKRLHSEAFRAADGAAATRNGGREITASCNGDGFEHGCHQTESALKKPVGYYRLFCAHDRPRWQPCSASTCRRSAKEAAENWMKLQRGELR